VEFDKLLQEQSNRNIADKKLTTAKKRYLHIIRTSTKP